MNDCLSYKEYYQMRAWSLYFIVVYLLFMQNLFAQQEDIFVQFALQKREEIPGLEKNPLPLTR